MAIAGRIVPEGARPLRLPDAPKRVQQANKVAWNTSRSQRQADFFTVGYSGRNLTEFVAVLRLASISTLVDVRFAPVSLYKPDFSKEKLRRVLESEAITYIHRMDLGVPREIRAGALESATRDGIWEWYDEQIVPGFAGKNLNVFFDAWVHPIAFMCTEFDPTACHRHRLSIALERHGLNSFDL